MPATKNSKPARSRKPIHEQILDKGIRPDSLRFVDPKTLSAHPRNWRNHPKRQRRNYTSLKSKVNWAGACLFNETTGHLLDGHMRVDEAIKANESQVPVLYGRWSEDEEKLILASLDTISGMAQTDEVALQTLTAEIDDYLSGLNGKDKEAQESLRKMTADLDAYAKQIEAGESPSIAIPSSKAPLKSRKKSDSSDSSGGSDDSDDSDDSPSDGENSSFQGDDEVEEVVMKDDVLFSSSNRWGIPDLLPELLAKIDDTLPLHVFDRNPALAQQEDVWYCYGSKPFPTKDDLSPEGTVVSALKGGTLGFHTEDYRFEHCYEYPTEFVEELHENPWTLVCEPEFSVYGDWPFAMRLWNLYRSRWCARYWQAADFSIIPALRWCFTEADAAWLYGTLPLDGSCEVVSMAFGCGAKPTSQDLEDLTRTVSLSFKLIQYKRLIVYGDKAASKYYLPVIHKAVNSVWDQKRPPDFDVISLPSFMEARREYFKDKPRKKRHR